MKWMRENGWIESICVTYLKDGIMVFEAIKDDTVVQHFSYNPQGHSNRSVNK